MTEIYGNYSATVLGTEDGVSCDIDVRPPFVPSEGLLSFCRDECGVELRHFVTTPNTTRLLANILDESLSDEVMEARFRDAATFLVRVLQSVDEGRDVVYQDYPHSDESVEALPAEELAPDTQSEHPDA